MNGIKRVKGVFKHRSLYKAALSVVEGDFAAIRSLYDECLKSYPALAEDFTELSIGMSDDYPVAVRYGSTMVRIGSMIFGSRA